MRYRKIWRLPHKNDKRPSAPKKQGAGNPLSCKYHQAILGWESKNKQTSPDRKHILPCRETPSQKSIKEKGEASRRTYKPSKDKHTEDRSSPVP